MRIPIGNLREGDHVAGIYLCKNKVNAKTKAGKAYYSLTLQDASGGWVDDDGTLYQEYTVVIYLSDTNEEQVHAAADELLQVFDQSSVLIQKNPTNTEFYSGK